MITKLINKIKQFTIMYILYYPCLLITKIIRYDNILKSKRVSKSKLPLDINYVVVFGSGLKYTLTEPAAVLKNRLDKVIKEFNNSNYKILLSGDRFSKIDNYDEPKVMKEYILKNSNIRESQLIEDPYGLYTINTIINCKKKYNIKKCVFISNNYHQARILHLARFYGIDGYVLNINNENYSRIKLFKRRETIAQVKDLILCHFNK